MSVIWFLRKRFQKGSYRIWYRLIWIFYLLKPFSAYKVNSGTINWINAELPVWYSLYHRVYIIFRLNIIQALSMVQNSSLPNWNSFPLTITALIWTLVTPIMTQVSLQGSNWTVQCISYAAYQTEVSVLKVGPYLK